MPTFLTSGLLIDHLTFRIQNYRNLRRGLRAMAYDIQKIKRDAMMARGNMERIGVAYAKLAIESGAHADDVAAMNKDVTELQTDLDALKQIKNSSGE